MSDRDEGRALPPTEDRAVVNGAGQAVSALRASVPSAGDWVVIGHRRSWDRAFGFEAAQVVKVTKRLIYAEAHYRQQHDPHNVLLMPDEQTARLFEAQAKSAYAEARRRERAAWEAYNTTVGKMCAQAIEARRAETAKQAPSSDESAVPKGCAMTQPPSGGETDQ